MLDLAQGKLTKEEWNSIEIPLPDDEKYIANIICQGYHNVHITNNNTLSFIVYLKLPVHSGTHDHIYNRYIAPELTALTQAYNFGIVKCKKSTKSNHNKRLKKRTTLKSADKLRLDNADKKVNSIKSSLFEFVLLDVLKQLHICKHASTNWYQHFYTLKQLLQYNIPHINTPLVEVLHDHINDLSKQLNVLDLIKIAPEAIEKNEKILNYADTTLFDHQKQLFTICKRPHSKLVSYIAPTGTGKTLSPLGLSEKKRVIFVCAARHVGLALAKAAISLNKKVAFAFGCDDASDIRLHYFSAKEYIKNRKSGGIAKVDNSVGDDVEIIISDLKSYLVSMYYMLAFNKKEDIILYWDEPTITLDYSEHPLHSIIQKNWSENIIPNIVFSSATLPNNEELHETTRDFTSKFENAEVHFIVSHDIRKTIPLFDKKGNIIMPHTISSNCQEVKTMARHCLDNYTLMRYLDLESSVSCILLFQKHPEWLESEKYNMNYFIPNIDSVNMTSIKTYYLMLLIGMVPSYWDTIKETLHNYITQKNTGARLTTTDAHTLTDGPAIYLAENVEKVAAFQLQDAKLPSLLVKHIMKAITFNSVLSDKIAVLQKALDDGLQKEEGKDKKLSSGKMPTELRQIKTKIEDFQACVKSVSLSSIYIPNTFDHLQKYAGSQININNHNAFSSDISEDIVERIMLIDDIEDNWKLLLLMGIGVFASHKSAKYTEIMKTLAHKQKLYLIIASSDYIYGTNYQFCHGYLGKDMADMSQEKCIQAMGRVGRKSVQKTYSLRFRDETFAKKVFHPDKNKPEVLNMAKLFTTPISI